MQINMSSNHSRTSLSSDEHRRKSPRRSPKRAKTSLQKSQEKSPLKRSKSFTDPGSTDAKSPPTSRTRTKSKTRKTSSNLQQSSTNLSDGEVKQVNNKERQDLSARGLSMVPSEVMNLVTLRFLILSNNNLSGLPPTIRNLIHLEYLDLSRNPLRVKNGLDDFSCLPREFCYLRNLQTLILAECTLKHIPPAVWNTTSIETLDLSRNKVGFIVGEIGNLANLRYLRLSQMDLDSLPAEIGFCEKLLLIDLTGNPVDNLPETLIECRQLYELKINFQTFHKRLDHYLLELIDEGKIRSEHLPTVIFEFEHLLSLDLDGTFINTIPVEHMLFHLVELNLSNNSLTHFPEALATMKELKLLNMSSNYLKQIDPIVTSMKQLETLILSENQLTSLSTLLAQISTLKQLVVRGNQIETIDEGWRENLSLITLDLSSNRLENVSDHLCTLKQLENLDLRSNQIDSLPFAIPNLINLKSMNKFDGKFQRIGLHLLGNPLSQLPSHVWKTTNIETLFQFIRTEEKLLEKNYFHCKIIFLGPKNVGKTSLIVELNKARNNVLHKRETFDLHLSTFETFDCASQLFHAPSEHTSSIATDQWIENRVSTVEESLISQIGKIKRTNPPPLRTYRKQITNSWFMNQSSLITTNNLYCTLIDLTSETNYEILYPLIYDSKALFVIPVNLTILLEIIRTATVLENLHLNESSLNLMDFDNLLTNDWLDCHLFRYIQSISDYCQTGSIAIVGLMKKNSLDLCEHAQQLLDEIHSKVNMFLTDETNERKNIRLYSDYFPQPLFIDDERISSILLGQFDNIAQQWNFKHHKEKRKYLKERLGLIGNESLVLDYSILRQRFQQTNEDNEIPSMDFDSALDYLQLTGDIVRWASTIIIKPYFLLNRILSQTFFRPHLDQWLNYEENLLFHFSGFYPTQKRFDIDRHRLLTRGEFTWNMLKTLFFDQFNQKIDTNEKLLINYCRLMERLYLGFVSESNLNYHEFTTISFVCPWLLRETASNFDYRTYFTRLEQQRVYEQLKCEQMRRFKQKQLWFALDYRQGYVDQRLLMEKDLDEETSISSVELPAVETIDIDPLEIISSGELRRIQIEKFPQGFYQRLMICLHPFFNERLDYANITVGRTQEKHLIQIERVENNRSIDIVSHVDLIEPIRTRLIDELFSFYPSFDFSIKT